MASLSHAGADRRQDHGSIDGMTTIVRIAGIRIDLHRRIKVYAAEHGMTMSEATERALGEGIDILEGFDLPTDSFSAPPEAPQAP